MKCLIQRVSEESVDVDSVCVGSIGRGLLVFVGVEPTDTAASLTRMAERLLGYRVFADADGRMNLSVADVKGDLLLVSQFTLAADTRKGTRPGFQTAAPPKLAASLFEQFVNGVKQRHKPVATGQFGANMQVSLVNDGPVTFLLEV